MTIRHHTRTENATKIQYDTATLERQWRKIVISKLNALEKLSDRSHCITMRLDESDPSELWCYFVGRRPQPSAELTGERARALAAQIRSYKPDFAADPETYRKFRERIGTPTLADTVSALANRFQDDAALGRHLTKLLSLRKGRLLRRHLDAAGFSRTALLDLAKRFPPDDTELAKNLEKLLGLSNKGLWRDKFLEAKTADLLVQNWIEDSPGDDFIARSFCFFSDRAMATFIHRLLWNEWLVPERADTDEQRARKLRLAEIETTYIKKLYQRLGLLPAKPRAIREIRVRFAMVEFVPFRARVPKRSSVSP